MKTIADYIKEIKKLYELDSYYAVMNSLGMPRQTWTKLKNGNGVSDKNAIKIAEKLGIDPIEVIATSHSLAAKNREEKAIWQKLAKEKEENRKSHQ